MEYDQLLKIINKEKIDLIQMSFNGNLKGLYGDGIIAISNSLTTTAEKKCILAEEIGHYFTSSGNILNKKDINSMQQEHRARYWASEKLITFDRLIDAFNNGIKNKYELAEYLEITEEFLEESIDSFKNKYGLQYNYKNYIICFDPLNIYIAS